MQGEVYLYLLPSNNSKLTAISFIRDRLKPNIQTNKKLWITDNCKKSTIYYPLPTIRLTNRIN